MAKCQCRIEKRKIISPNGVSSQLPSCTAYTVNGRCDCQDYDRAPANLCKHRLAYGIARRVQELLPQTQEHDDVRHVETPAPLYEAPASINLKVLVQGHEVMVTLRDHDEAALLTRVGALLKRQDIRPIPKPAPRSGNWQGRKQGR